VSLKMLREDLCRRQVQADEWPSSIASAVEVLIAMIDKHRPLGPDGKHGYLHTPTCGCVDKVVPGACGDPSCPVLHADPANPIHPPT
jgi:hypothetical protein